MILYLKVFLVCTGCVQYVMVMLYDFVFKSFSCYSVFSCYACTGMYSNFVLLCLHFMHEINFYMLKV